VTRAAGRFRAGDRAARVDRDGCGGGALSVRGTRFATDPPVVLDALVSAPSPPANDNVGSRAFDFNCFKLPSKENPMASALDRKRTITALNDLLRGELSAVETYDMALPLIVDDHAALADLRACRSSHQDRVDLLRNAIVQAGGEPVDSSGAWGAFARAVEGSASTLGSSLAVKTLEKGEEHGLRE